MIKKGTKVKVLVGKDKNKDGEVMEIDRSNNRAKVKGINMVKKHVKTTKEKLRSQLMQLSTKKKLMSLAMKNKNFIVFTLPLVKKDQL